jgi:hypothetical protein
VQLPKATRHLFFNFFHVQRAFGGLFGYSNKPPRWDLSSLLKR